MAKPIRQTTLWVADDAAEGMEEAGRALVKWVTPNDAGTTGSHQGGFHIPKSAWSLFFERPGRDGENLRSDISITWVGWQATDSVVTWYGKETRSEYRLTRFGRGFPFRGDEHVGSLLVLHPDVGGFRAQVLSTDREIESFLGDVGLTAGDVGGLVTTTSDDVDDCLQRFTDDVLHVHRAFPSTAEMSRLARAASDTCYSAALSSLDEAVVTWTRVEYRLFRALEDRAFEADLSDAPVDTVDRLIKLGLRFTNRRKARAGGSFEHHLAACWDRAGLSFEGQVETERGNTMDFVFPGAEAYHDSSHPVEGLVALGAKTSAKERWRQVLDEADRTPNKYLVTLQPVPLSTIRSMSEVNLQLVVPKEHQPEFGRDARSHLLTLEDFADHVRSVMRANI